MSLVRIILVVLAAVWVGIASVAIAPEWPSVLGRAISEVPRQEAAPIPEQEQRTEAPVSVPKEASRAVAVPREERPTVVQAGEPALTNVGVVFPSHSAGAFHVGTASQSIIMPSGHLGLVMIDPSCRSGR